MAVALLVFERTRWLKHCVNILGIVSQLLILFCRVNGLHCILITDRDGVPLVRVATDRAPALALRPNFISTFGMATDQGSKLGLGRNKSVICMYSNYQVNTIMISLWQSLGKLTVFLVIIYFFVNYKITISSLSCMLYSFY